MPLTMTDLTASSGENNRSPLLLITRQYFRTQTLTETVANLQFSRRIIKFHT